MVGDDVSSNVLAFRNSNSALRGSYSLKVDPVIIEGGKYENCM